ncbi:MAG: GIY-YIG nuclease family protein [Dehalococcoidia bacterium]|nr:GIY-YIG nuclease family protein [Dehalococcoidia bacterium]
MSKKHYCVYILASTRNGALYIGVTSDLPKGVYQHKNDLLGGFTQKYRVHDLVYYETTDDVNAAITREKQLKKWERAWKIRLIEERNPGWEELCPLTGYAS